MSENWYALFIATQFKVTVEQAFEMFEEGKLGRKNNFITSEDIEDMKVTRGQGLSYKAIGEIYGIADSVAWYRMNNAKTKKERFN